MIKRILLALVLIASLVGCARAETSSNIVDEFECSYFDNLSNVYLLTDKTTGVEYILYIGIQKAGLSPRYNADGTLKINEEWSSIDE